MNKLEKLAVRIGEISEEIRELKSQREINLEHCHESPDEDFEADKEVINHAPRIVENCLFTAYRWVEDIRKAGDYESFNEAIRMYGCKNCVGAHDAKQKIGLLKQERGRIVGNISKIGKSL